MIISMVRHAFRRDQTLGHLHSYNPSSEKPRSHPLCSQLSSLQPRLTLPPRNLCFLGRYLYFRIHYPLYCNL
jgi:hypothetical protein